MTNPYSKVSDWIMNHKPCWNCEKACEDHQPCHAFENWKFKLDRLESEIKIPKNTKNTGFSAKFDGKAV